MLEVASSLTTIAFLTFFYLLTVHRVSFSSKERTWLNVAFGLHIVSSWVQMFLLYTLYGRGGDLGNYYMAGERLRSLVLEDFSYFPDLLILSLGMEVDLPINILGNGSATGAMCGLAGLLLIVTQGGKYAANAIVSYLAFLGLVALYWAFRTLRKGRPDMAALVATLFLPSLTFWVSGMQKEAVAVFGLGILIAGIVGIQSNRSRLLGLLLLGSGLLVTYGVKPYALVALGAAVGALFVQNDKGSGFRKLLKVLVGGAVALVLVSYFIPKYSPEQALQQTGYLQSQYATIDAGSSFDFTAAGGTTWQEQIRNAPLAAISTYLRPFFFEIHNFTSALSAIETSVFLLLLLTAMFRRSPKKIVGLILGNSSLLFCAVFVAVFGLAVGLAAPNLGTLSRYRVPMLPMYAYLLLALAAPVEVSRSQQVSRGPKKSSIKR